MRTVDRIQHVIQESGLTQAAFGQRIELEPSKLSKSLKGTRKFTSLEIARIAQEFQVSVDWILTGAIDELTAAARTGQESARPDSALTKAREYVTARADLRSLGISRSWKLDLAGQLRGRRWIDQGNSLAETVTRILPDVARQEDLASAIESAFQVDVAIQNIGDLDGIAAATDSARLIVASPTPNYSRQRFTIAHELAHLLACDDQQLHRDHNVTAKGGEGEIRANAFAAAFLMPEAVLRDRVGAGLNDSGFAQLSWELLVSPSALAWRLFNMKLITEEQKEKWRALSADACVQQVGRQAEHVTRCARSSQTRIPALLLADAWSAWSAGKTTLRPVANLMGVSSTELRERLSDLELS